MLGLIKHSVRKDGARSSEMVIWKTENGCTLKINVLFPVVKTILEEYYMFEEDALHRYDQIRKDHPGWREE